MPTYDYKCKSCQQVFSISAPMETVISLIPQCPVCKSGETQRVYFKTPTIFKGKGFYKTDNQNP